MTKLIALLVALLPTLTLGQVVGPPLTGVVAPLTKVGSKVSAAAYLTTATAASTYAPLAGVAGAWNVGGRLSVYGVGALGGTLEVGAGTAGVNVDLLLNGGSDSGKGPAIAFYRGGSVKGYVGTHSYIIGGASDATMLYGASTVELGVGGAVIGTVTSTGIDALGLSVGGKAISFGAADSGGAGYRTMKIAN